MSRCSQVTTWVADLVVEHESRLLPAAIALAVTGANLAALGRIDPMETNAAAADFDGVAIDNRGVTRNAIRGCRLHGEDYCGAEEKQGTSCHSVR